jgi:hypothetical protein
LITFKAPQSPHRYSTPRIKAAAAAAAAAAPPADDDALVDDVVVLLLVVLVVVVAFPAILGLDNNGNKRKRGQSVRVPANYRMVGQTRISKRN